MDNNYNFCQDTHVNYRRALESDQSMTLEKSWKWSKWKVPSELFVSVALQFWWGQREAKIPIESSVYFCVENLWENTR